MNSDNAYIADGIKFIPAKPQNSVRFVCISDTHGKSLKNLPAGDVLLCAGDFTMLGDIPAISRFNAYLGKLPYKHKVVIAGNHELLLDDEHANHLSRRFNKTRRWKSDLIKYNVNKGEELLTNCVYLKDQDVNIDGIKIYGSPWVPDLNDWAFYCERESMSQVWSNVPADCDILLTHTAPFGYGDRVVESNSSFYKDGASLCKLVGCRYLLDKVKEINPKFHVFGHIHEGHGIYSSSNTVFINCAICDKEYQPTQYPIIFDFMKENLLLC
ncbi:hypothetical protein GJ496_009403 [Pomphorhynchus laevis]|nr:hypothetical protein GJ496_009403 [Pomphorhynchus laevis]